MAMNWESPAAFFAMGGHGAFVWGSYAVCLAFMVGEPLLARRRQRVARAAAAAEARRRASAQQDDEDLEG
jgi:heme exporter protein D